jgi:hypothetical protein
MKPEAAMQAEPVDFNDFMKAVNEPPPNPGREENPRQDAGVPSPGKQEEKNEITTPCPAPGR